MKQVYKYIVTYSTLRASSMHNKKPVWVKGERGVLATSEKEVRSILKEMVKAPHKLRILKIRKGVAIKE